MAVNGRIPVSQKHPLRTCARKAETDEDYNRGSKKRERLGCTLGEALSIGTPQSGGSLLRFPLRLVLLLELDLLGLFRQSPDVALGRTGRPGGHADVSVGLFGLALVASRRLLDAESHAPEDVRDRLFPPDAFLSLWRVLVRLGDDQGLARLFGFLDRRLAVVVLDLERRGGQERAEEFEDREVVVDGDPVERSRQGRVLRDERRCRQSREQPLDDLCSRASRSVSAVDSASSPRLTQVTVPSRHVQRRVPSVVLGFREPPVSIVLGEALNVPEVVLLEVTVPEAVEQSRKLVSGRHRSGRVGGHAGQRCWCSSRGVSVDNARLEVLVKYTTRASMASSRTGNFFGSRSRSPFEVTPRSSTEKSFVRRPHALYQHPGTRSSGRALDSQGRNAGATQAFPSQWPCALPNLAASARNATMIGNHHSEHADLVYIESSRGGRAGFTLASHSSSIICREPLRRCCQIVYAGLVSSSRRSVHPAISACSA